MPSENGWEPSHATADQCEWITVPGTNPPVNLQLLKGQPLALLRAYAADHNAYVEPLEDADCAGYTPTNSVATSNHLNGTAIDLAWTRHPFHVSYAGYNADQIATVRELLAFYTLGGVQMIWWGQDWGGNPFDCMHFNCGYDTYGNPLTQQFIDRFIRPDGFSTFRRDNVPVPPPPPPVLSRADGYALKIIAEGQRLGITPRGIQIALATGLVESNLTIYANEAVPESMSIPHDAVGSDAYSVGIFQQQVRDTGSGWWWGDAATCMDPTSSAGLFYDRLAKLDYNGHNSPGSYAQAVQSSAFPDRYDQRFNDAVAIYNRLATGAPPAPPPLPGDDMALVPQAQWDALYHAYMDDVPSLSPLRHLGEGNVGPVHRILRNIDGSEHVEVVKLLAELGHQPTIDLLNEVAAADPAQYPDRQQDAVLARNVLRAAMKTWGATPAGSAVNNAPSPAAPQVVYVDRPVPAAPAALPAPVSENGAAPTTTGQAIGALFDALESMRLADALPIEARAPLAALISVLQTKNGAAL